MEEQDSPRLLRRLSRRFSQYFGSYEGRWLHSPIWIGILTMFFEITPNGTTLALTAELQTQQFGDDLYWWTIGPMILQSILSMPALALVGYLSQPHRVGRKKMALFLMFISTICCAVPALTEDAYIIVLAQTLASPFGCGKSSDALFVTILAWCTDWCKPNDKAKYFGIIMGCLFGAVSVSPSIPYWVGIHSTHGVFLFAALFKLVGPVFVMFFFPKATPCVDHDADPPSPAAFSRRFSTSPGFTHESDQEPPNLIEASESPSGARKTMSHVWSALKYLFVRKFAATLVYVMINLTDAAVQDVVAVFLLNERNFSVPDLNALICIIGAFGFFMQTIGVPVVNAWGVRSEFLLVVGVLAMITHFAVYAFVAKPLYILMLEPIGSLGYVAVIASTAIVSGTSATKDVPRDQGTLIGTLNGVKMLASCIGPLMIAAFTTYQRQFPWPLNFAGIGFAALSVMMVVALIPALKLCCSRRKSEAYS